MNNFQIKGFNNDQISITIVPTNASKPIETISEIDALENAEASIQIFEGSSYEFLIENGFQLEEINSIVSNSKLNPQAGRITPNIYVGTLQINILDSNSERRAVLCLEVKSTKSAYRTDYRTMLENIAEKCTDLLMQHSSPVVQTFTIDFEKDSETQYQRFAFIKSIIDSEEFEISLQKIFNAPTTKWKEIIVDKPIHGLKKLNRQVVRQFFSSSNRIPLPSNHAFQSIESLPEKIKISSKEETVDTPENRFIKFSLETFSKICSDFSHLRSGSRVAVEASYLEEKLEHYLGNSLFSEVSALSSLPFNNPVLQRKEGYREIYRAWLLQDLAAKLIWKGGDDVYNGNKRDVAVLYEYWLFFKLIEVVTDVFEIDPPKPEDLIDETDDGFGLKLRQGRYLPIKGVSDKGIRRLNVQLSYNRTYQGDQEYPKAGSWSRNLRPDYTLSIWPFGVNEIQAEKEELIVHIHFDAKYKVENFQEIFSDNVELDTEKVQQRTGTYHRADLLKMHSYKDAIRRTAGAYVLYPGTDQPKRKHGFHELIPGLGAFAIRPTQIDNGIDELKAFLHDVVTHFMNRASQREKMSYRTFDIYKDGSVDHISHLLPEAFGPNRHYIPDEIFILVGYYPEKNWNWIIKNGLYNARTGDRKGSLVLSQREVNAKYILLHSTDKITDKLFKITGEGPRVFSKNALVEKGYPSKPDNDDHYLVYSIKPADEEAFLNISWDVSKLKEFKSGRDSYLPFSVTMSELMKVIVKTDV